ncbi:exocyst complex component 4-like isoform X2 [Oscarella lobularis]|uniref:exocyst complex component 4-like isoform X2 n=1 Tax=Oscarella lobularis TaxID=121494 RepID=UPI003313CAA5
MGSESALLVSLIKNLAKDSSSEAQRDRVKDELTENYRREDEKLEKIVENHYDHLKGSVTAFTHISARVVESRNRIRTLRRTIDECKTKLRCRRDELRKLWTESVQSKETLRLLDKIESVKKAPEDLKVFTDSRQYLDATHLLVKTVDLLDGELAGVKALAGMRTEMAAEKAKLLEVLREELHRHVYVRSSAAQVRKRHKLQSIENLKPSPQMPKKLLAVSGKTAGDSRAGSSEDVHSAEGLEPDLEDGSQYLTMLVECLAVLKMTPDIVETLKKKLPSDLEGIVDGITEQIADNSHMTGLLATHQPHLLLELLLQCFDKFRAIATAHSVVLTALRKSITENPDGGTVELYKEADVWSAIQYSVERLLTQYLDLRSFTSNTHRLTTFGDAGSLSSYFMPKKKGGGHKGQKKKLFRFEASSHALSVKSYMREQWELQQEEGIEESMPHAMMPRLSSTPIFVCKPDMKNITLVFVPLRAFIKEIEVATDCEPDSHCLLYEFLEDYVVNTFLESVADEMTSKLEAAIKGFDVQRVLADDSMLKQAGSAAPSKPVLQSAVVMEQNMRELRDMMERLPPYAEHFLNMISDMLLKYRDSCSQLYKHILGVTEDGRLRTISGMWAKDEDIRRLLKSFPAWTHMQQQQEQQGHHKSKKVQEDLETVQEHHRQECEMLTRNIGDRLLIKSAVVLSLGDLKVVAHLQESLEWLANRTEALLATLTSLSSVSIKKGSVEVPGALLRGVDQLRDELCDLAETCLIMLHLEIRCHCYFFLLPAAKQSTYVHDSDSMEVDEHVRFFNNDLKSTKEVMEEALSYAKFKYLFEGLGYLIASILISSTNFLGAINDYGIKRMCNNIYNLQQNLTNITMSRELDLARARQYFELLFLNPEELLTVIVEQGPQFTEVQYGHILRLGSQRLPKTERDKLPRQLDRLREILQDLI